MGAMLWPNDYTEREIGSTTNWTGREIGSMTDSIPKPIGSEVINAMLWPSDYTERRARSMDRLHTKTHRIRDNKRYALAKRLYRKGGQINGRLHTKTHRVRDNKRYALAKRLYRNGGQINDRINAGRNNQRRDWTRSQNNQSKQRFSSFRNTQRFHRSQGHAQSTRRLARR